MVVIAGVAARPRPLDPKIGSFYAPDRLDRRGDLPSLPTENRPSHGCSQMAK